jgi:transcriptional regulator with XRE-family HTH domain
MSPHELTAFRRRMGWSRDALARQLDISASRLADFEKGSSRGRNAQPAPIPKMLEFACRWLEHRQANQHPPLTPAERAAAWADFIAGLDVPRDGYTIDDSRDGIYGRLPGGRRL